MFRGLVPMLTRGSFASYYGGCVVLAQLGPGPSSPVSPVFVTISILFQVPLCCAVLYYIVLYCTILLCESSFQVSLYTLKKVKMRKLDTKSCQNTGKRNQIYMKYSFELHEVFAFAKNLY